jgi:hypothetical protein
MKVEIRNLRGPKIIMTSIKNRVGHWGDKNLTLLVRGSVDQEIGLINFLGRLKDDLRDD